MSGTKQRTSIRIKYKKESRSLPSQLSLSPSSLGYSSRSTSPNTLGSTSPNTLGSSPSWPQSQSSLIKRTSSDSICQEVIKKNVDKLGHLADKCERLNTNLSHVVTESHKILDNSYLSSQVHLTNHVANLNYNACIDIVIAINAHSEYMDAVQELAEAEEVICNDLMERGESLSREAELFFTKVRFTKHDCSIDI